MKATELRIGNLINRNGIIITVSWGTLKAICENIDVGNPIPVTEEWLQKFEWIKTGGILNTHTDKNYQYVLEYDNEWNFINANEMTFLKTIKFVHEFQNLYFALTGYELTLQI